jgi:hypothetical protein
LSWVEIILLLSAVIASAEILKVSEPGVDNTGEVIAMAVGSRDPVRSRHREPV